jgi:hypothetical protein
METTADHARSKLDICTVAASPLMRRVNQVRLKVDAVTLYEINKALETKDLPQEPLEEVIPTEYHTILPLFSKVIAEMLPPHEPYDHSIQLQEGFPPPFGPIYSSSQDILQVLQEWIEMHWF